MLIDGVEGDSRDAQPNDIESVRCSKDASFGRHLRFARALLRRGAHHHQGPGQTHRQVHDQLHGQRLHPAATAIPDVVDDGYVYSRLFYDAWYNYRFNEPTGFNNSQDFSRAWLDTFRQRKLAGNKLETTVDPDGKYVYYGIRLTTMHFTRIR